VSPDGHWVGAIVEGGQAIHVVATEQKTSKFTLPQPKDWQASNLAFSPDNDNFPTTRGFSV
jgi:hypothetical protein